MDKKEKEYGWKNFHGPHYYVNLAMKQMEQEKWTLVNEKIVNMSMLLPFELDIELFKDIHFKIAMLSNVINPVTENHKQSKSSLFQTVYKSWEQYPMTKNAFITELILIRNVIECLEIPVAKRKPDKEKLCYGLLYGSTHQFAKRFDLCLKDLNNEKLERFNRLLDYCEGLDSLYELDFTMID